MSLTLLRVALGLKASEAFRHRRWWTKPE